MIAGWAESRSRLGKSRLALRSSLPIASGCSRSKRSTSARTSPASCRLRILPARAKPFLQKNSEESTLIDSPPGWCGAAVQCRGAVPRCSAAGGGEEAIPSTGSWGSIVAPPSPVKAAGGDHPASARGSPRGTMLRLRPPTAAGGVRQRSCGAVRSGGGVDRLGVVRSRAVVPPQQVAGAGAVRAAEIAAARMQLQAVHQAVRGVALHAFAGPRVSGTACGSLPLRSSSLPLGRPVECRPGRSAVEPGHRGFRGPGGRISPRNRTHNAGGPP